MSFWDNWPFSNFHNLNLDWILKTLKDLSGELASGIVNTFNGRSGVITLESDDVADVLTKSMINNLGIEKFYLAPAGQVPSSYDQTTLSNYWDNGYRAIVVANSNGAYQYLYVLTQQSGNIVATYYNPTTVNSVNGKLGNVVLYATDVNAVPATTQLVNTFNSRSGTVTLNTADVNNLGITAIEYTDPNTDPASFSASDLEEFYNNGIRFFAVPNSDGDYTTLYFLTRLGLGTSASPYTYSAVEYQPAIAAGAVIAVNGQTGDVTLDAEDVGALASNTTIVNTVNGASGTVTLGASDVGALGTGGTNGDYVANIQAETEGDNILSGTKYYNGGQVSVSVPGVRSVNGSYGNITTNAWSQTTLTVTNSDVTVVRNVIYYNPALKLAIFEFQGYVAERGTQTVGTFPSVASFYGANNYRFAQISSTSGNYVSVHDNTLYCNSLSTSQYDPFTIVYRTV